MKPLILNACEIYVIGTLKCKVMHYMADILGYERIYGLCYAMIDVCSAMLCIDGCVELWYAWMKVCIFGLYHTTLTRSTKLVVGRGVDMGCIQANEVLF